MASKDVPPQKTHSANPQKIVVWKVDVEAQKKKKKYKQRYSVGN